MRLSRVSSLFVTSDDRAHLESGLYGGHPAPSRTAMASSEAPVGPLPKWQNPPKPVSKKIPKPRARTQTPRQPSLVSMAATASNPFPFPSRRPPDDSLFYAVYPLPLPSGLPAPALHASLQSLHLSLLSHLAPFLSSHLFHRDPFTLSLPADPAAPCALCASPPVPHLHGALRFGDSLPDEWLAVSLLFALTRAFPDIAARAWDSDGEFLLIEAAFALPRWLDPESAPNRVFIFRGELHILPPSLFPETPSLEAALAAVYDDSIDTRAADAIQAAIQRRIAGLPEKAAENLHTARVIVPAPVAKVLKEEPCLIARAVEGFYDRDIDTMKHAARMEKFLKGPGGEGVEMVRTTVRMTRAMYAQLVQQNFQAPRGYPMPRREEGPEKWMEAELGMKIACGFEMMYQERRRQGEEGKGSTWEVYRKSLEAAGCFEGLLPGSMEYKRVMEDAMQYYKSSNLYSRTRCFESLFLAMWIYLSVPLPCQRMLLCYHPMHKLFNF